MKTVHILGAGGIGIAAAASLAEAGVAVVLVDRNKQKVAAAQAGRCSLNGKQLPPLEVVDFNDWSPCGDAPVLLCTKTFDNADVLARIDDPSLLVPIQNGYEPHLERLSHPVEAIASFVSHCPVDGVNAVITRAGDLHIGRRTANMSDSHQLTKNLASALATGGRFKVRAITDIRPFKATKLMYNAAISPLAAAAGVDNAELITDPLAQQLFFALLKENYRIIRASGQRMMTIGPFHPTTVMRILGTPFLPAILGIFFRPSLRGTYCSMSPDMGTSRTEIDAYNGHLLRIAGAVPCPINQAVVQMVEEISRNRTAPSRSHLVALASTLPEGVLC